MEYATRGGVLKKLAIAQIQYWFPSKKENASNAN